MRKGSVLLAVFLAIGPSVASAGDDESARQVVVEMIEAVNQRDFEALDALVAENVVRHSAATPGVRVRSLAEFKAFLHQDLEAMPDAHQTVNLIFAADGMVAVHVTYAGTQTGTMGPFPPSGKKVSLPFIGILRIEKGKIAEMWVEWDNLGALVQLGHFSPPSGE